MNSYNKLNGTYLCENKEILSDMWKAAHMRYRLVNSVTDIPKVYTRNSTIGEILADTNGKEIFQKTMAQMLGDNAQLIAAQEDNSGAINEEMMTAMAEGMSLRQLLSFIPGVSRNVLEELINKLNKHKFKMEEAQQYWIMRSLLSPPIFPFILEKQFFL